MAYYLRIFCTSARPTVDIDASGRSQILVTVNGRDDDDELFREELIEFQERVAESPLSEVRARVLEHLEQTTAIVALELRVSGFSEAAFAAAEAMAASVASSCKGLVHADGEGFYEDGQLILPLE